MIRAGAADYISKDKLARLAGSVRTQVQAAEQRRAREEAEAAVRRSEVTLRAALEAITDAHLLLSAIRDERDRIVDFRCDHVSAGLSALVGVTAEELEGGTLLELAPAHRSLGLFDAYCQVTETGEPLQREDVLFRDLLDGHQVKLQVDLRAVRVGDGCAISVRDVSERARHEAERQRLQEKLMRVYALIVRANAAIVRARTPQELFGEVCRVAVQSAGFALAWVGRVDRSSGLIEPAASYGRTSYLDGLRVTLAPELATSQGPSARAVRERRPAVCNDLAEPSVGQWRDRMLAHGFLASGAFPLVRGGEVVGVLCVYATTASWFTEEESGLIARPAADMALALHAREQEAELLSAEHLLRAVTDSMAEGMFALDESGKVTYMNRAASEMLQWSEAELRGRSMHEVAHYQREDGSVYPEAECSLRQVGAGRSSIAMEHDVFTRRNGDLLPVAYSASPVIDGGHRGSSWCSRTSPSAWSPNAVASVSLRNSAGSGVSVMPSPRIGSCSTHSRSSSCAPARPSATSCCCAWSTRAAV